MSVYANYDIISKYYDTARRPNGAHHYLGIVYSLTGKTKENLHLLDMGCGTGNHVQFLLDQGLAKATIFDANPGMLEKAKEKLRHHVESGRITKIEENKLPNLPYDNETFDVVMCNQVLHHLTSTDDQEHKNIAKAIAEAYRVLKRDGVLIVNLNTPQQVAEGVWWAKLYPESVKATMARVIEPKKFLEIFRKAGFTREGMIVEPLDTIYSKEWHEQCDGPLYSEWRQIDSTVTSCSKEEMEKATEQVQNLKDSGKLQEFYDTHDAIRHSIGQYTIYYGKKQ